jgi:hypothetical protein
MPDLDDKAQEPEDDNTPEPEQPEVVAHSADGEDLPEDCGTFSCGTHSGEL